MANAVQRPIGALGPDHSRADRAAEPRRRGAMRAKPYKVVQPNIDRLEATLNYLVADGYEIETIAINFGSRGDAAYTVVVARDTQPNGQPVAAPSAQLASAPRLLSAPIEPTIDRIATMVD